MTLNDNLSNAMSHILNCEKVGKPTCKIANSGVIRGVLGIMKEHNYVDGFEVIKEGTKSHLLVTLNGNINKCNAVKPRLSVKSSHFEKYEKRYLPAYDIGLIIVSTPKGLTTHHEAKKNGIGGRLIAYVY